MTQDDDEEEENKNAMICTRTRWLYNLGHAQGKRMAQTDRSVMKQTWVQEPHQTASSKTMNSGYILN